MMNKVLTDDDEERVSIDDDEKSIKKIIINVCN